MNSAYNCQQPYQPNLYLNRNKPQLADRQGVQWCDFIRGPSSPEVYKEPALGMNEEPKEKVEAIRRDGKPPGTSGLKINTGSPSEPIMKPPEGCSAHTRWGHTTPLCTVLAARLILLICFFLQIYEMKMITSASQGRWLHVLGGLYLAE